LADKSAFSRIGNPRRSPATPAVSTHSEVEWDGKSRSVGQITAALAETKIYHLWMDTNQPGCAWRQERREWLMKRIRLLTTLLLLAGIAALAAPSARADSPLSEIIFYVH
jgi:hypothetical protein